MSYLYCVIEPAYGLIGKSRKPRTLGLQTPHALHEHCLTPVFMLLLSSEGMVAGVCKWAEGCEWDDIRQRRAMVCLDLTAFKRQRNQPCCDCSSMQLILLSEYGQAAQ